MPSPLENRDTNPDRKDTIENNDNPIGKRPNKGVTEFERHVREIATKQQNDNQQSTSTIDIRTSRQETEQLTTSRKWDANDFVKSFIDTLLCRRGDREQAKRDLVLEKMLTENTEKRIKSANDECSKFNDFLLVTLKKADSYKDREDRELFIVAYDTYIDLQERIEQVENTVTSKDNPYPAEILSKCIEELRKRERDLVNSIEPNNHVSQISNKADTIYNELKRLEKTNMGSGLLLLKEEKGFEGVEKSYNDKRQEAFCTYGTNPAFDEFLTSCLRLSQFASLISKQYSSHNTSSFPQLVRELDETISRMSNLNRSAMET